MNEKHALGVSQWPQCYIRPGENGFVFRSDDLDDLEACLHKIVSDRKRLVEMGHQATNGWSLSTRLSDM